VSDILLQIIWVAAHHGLRTSGPAIRAMECSCGVDDAMPKCPACRAGRQRSRTWSMVHGIGRELGFPPAPGPHEAVR
jgi:hypothetical protein